MTTILLADDHQILRQGLRSLLENEPDFRVVADTGNGLDAVRLAEAHQPDVLVVDLMMPGLNGLDVVRGVRQRSSRTRIIMLSMHGNEVYVVEALRLGASGYLLKESSSSELIQAVHTVMEGRHYLTTSLAERAIDAYIEKAGQAPTDSYELLSAREREVLHLAAEGLSNNEIAERLVISVRTVESHRANVMRKLGLKNQNDIVRYALQRGLLG